MENDRKIKIMLVEDDPDWLVAMTNFLNKEKDFIIVCTASTKDDAVEQASKIEFDVILMDISLSGNKKDGILAALQIFEIKDSIKIIMLTSLNENEIMMDSFIAGAVNYISKDEYLKIPGAIRTAIADKSPYNIVLNEFRKLSEEQQFLIYGITQAEREILELTEQGFTQSMICKKLYKSERTVKNQINSILKKMNVSTCKQAIEKIKMKGISKS